MGAFSIQGTREYPNTTRTDTNVADTSATIKMVAPVGNFALDPYFGYATIPAGSGTTIENCEKGSSFLFTGGNNQQANSISVVLYYATTKSTWNVSCAIYRLSDLSLVATTQSRLITPPPLSSMAWFTFNFTNPPALVNNTRYILMAFSDDQPGVLNTYYHTNTTVNEGHQESRLYSLGWDNPLSDTTTYSREYCIFCNYSSTIQYYLNVGTNNYGSFNVSSGWYNAGTVVPVLDTPNLNYQFSNFTLDSTLSYSNPISIPMTANHTLTCNNSLIQYYLNVTAPSHGSLNVTSGWFTNGTVTVLATPDSNYAFQYITVDGVNYAFNPYTITMNSSHTVTASFSPTQNQGFSIMWISDTQYLSRDYPAMFTQLTNWIANASSVYNVKMVIHTGDLVDNATSATQWDNANTSMMVLYNNGIPYCWDAGNHDQNTGPDDSWYGYNYTAFNTTLFSSEPYYVDRINQGKDTAVTFSYGSLNILVINLEYWANSTTLAWMTNLINAYPSYYVIVAAHSFLEANGTYGDPYANNTWALNLNATLSSYPQVFLTLSGHDATYPGANNTSMGARNDLFFNRQSLDSNQGADSVRIITFNTTSNTASVNTYLVWNNTWLTDPYNCFNFTAFGYQYLNISTTAHSSQNVTSGWYATGTTVPILDTPDSNYVTNYTLDGSIGTSNPLSITMSGNHTIAYDDYLPQYYLTVATPSHGSLNVTSGWFTNGTQVSVQATPDSNYVFQYITVDGVNYASNPYTITMDSPHTVTASFSPQYYLSVVSDGNEVINQTSGWFTNGTTVGILATPNTGYQFTNFTIDGVLVTSNPTSVLMTANHTVYAYASFSQYYLTVVPSSGGSMNATSAWYANGTVLNILATPDNNYIFNGFTLDGSNIGSSPVTVTMTANHTISASFSLLQYYLSVTPPTGGTLNVTSGWYTNGTIVPVLATPNQNYAFQYINIDGSNSSSNPYSLTINANHTITAYFTPLIQYYLTIGTVYYGSMNTTSGWYTNGTVVTVLETPDPNYRFANFTLDGTNSSSNPIYVVMTANHTLTASNYVLQYYLSVIGDGHETLNQTSAWFTNGTWVGILSTPSLNYIFSNFTIDGNPVGVNPTSVLMTSNHTVYAYSSPLAYYYHELDYTFMIFQNGTTYYAMNGMTGTIDNSSSTIMGALQYAVSSLNPALGGTIIVAPGNYSTNWGIQKNLGLNGVNNVSVGVLINNKNHINIFGYGATLVNTYPVPNYTRTAMFYLNSSNWVDIEGFTFNGSATATKTNDSAYLNAIFIDAGNFTTITHNSFYDCSQYSIFGDNTGYGLMVTENYFGESIHFDNGVSLHNTHNVATVSNNIFMKAGFAIQLDSVYGAIVSGNSIYRPIYGGLDIYDTVTGCIISNNIIDGQKSNAPYAAIWLEYNASKGNCTGNLISDNRIYNITTVGILMSGTNNTVIDNFISGTPIPIAVDMAGNTISDNVGWLTSNTGSFSSASNVTWIADGLAGAATQISITLSTQGYAWYGGVNATGFFAYFSTPSASGSWSATYKP